MKLGVFKMNNSWRFPISKRKRKMLTVRFWFGGAVHEHRLLINIILEFTCFLFVILLLYGRAASLYIQPVCERITDFLQANL